MKLVELVMNDEFAAEEGLTLISIVDKPATEQKMHFFSENKFEETFSDLDKAVEAVKNGSKDWNEEATAGLVYIALVSQGAIPLSSQMLFAYEGPSPERDFCNSHWKRQYTLSEIDDMLPENSEFNERGGGNYDKFKFKGGVNCKHTWEPKSIQRTWIDGSTDTIPYDDGDLDHNIVLKETLSDNGRNAGDYSMAAVSMYDSSPTHGRMSFRYAFVSEEQKTIVSPLMIPELKILRKNEEKGEYYEVFFSAETIKALNEKYFRELRVNESTVMHDMSLPNKWTMLESWIVEDPKRDKSATYGFDVPKGTWMVSFKILDETTWSKIKDGTFGGISLEGNFGEQLIHE